MVLVIFTNVDIFICFFIKYSCSVLTKSDCNEKMKILDGESEPKVVHDVALTHVRRKWLQYNVTKLVVCIALKRNSNIKH